MGKVLISGLTSTSTAGRRWSTNADDEDALPSITDARLGYSGRGGVIRGARAATAARWSARHEMERSAVARGGRPGAGWQEAHAEVLAQRSTGGRVFEFRRGFRSAIVARRQYVA